MKRQIASAMLLAAMIIIAHSSLFGRGQIPPPPPFSGGNAGDWLGSGPIFGFDDGGGPNGGWGGGYFELGGWSGWGSGPGGGHGGYRGGRDGRGEGRGHEWDGGEMGGLHGTCWVERLPGRRGECACSIKFQTGSPPPSGTRLFGVCTASDVTEDWYYSCSNAGDACSGYMP